MERIEDARRNDAAGMLVGIDQQDDEFVAAETCRHAPLAYGLFQTVRDLHQKANRILSEEDPNRAVACDAFAG